MHAGSAKLAEGYVAVALCMCCVVLIDKFMLPAAIFGAYLLSRCICVKYCTVSCTVPASNREVITPRPFLTSCVAQQKLAR